MSSPTSIRIGEERKKRIERTAAIVGLNYPETARQAIDFGLPILKEKLRKKKPCPASP